MKSVNDFQRFYSEIDNNIGFTLDVGHANINGATENLSNSIPKQTRTHTPKRQ
jgi:sugar phosphate isomerase/epimerase